MNSFLKTLPSQSDELNRLWNATATRRSCLFLTEGGWDAVRAHSSSDDASLRSLSAELASFCEHHARESLSQPPLEYVFKGRRLLTQSMRALARISFLALSFRLREEEEFLERLALEIEAVCAFPDWNPAHFLDVGGMALAVSIGLSWAGEFLPADTVHLGKAALLEKPIRPSFEEIPSHLFWVSGKTNWAQVCHGGLICAALEARDVEPELCLQTIQRALENLPATLENCSENGAYLEGPTYWNYGTTYFIVAADALRSTLGTDFGISDSTRLRNGGKFIRHATLPGGAFFNYGDCGKQRGFCAAMLWLAVQSQDEAALGDEAVLLKRLVNTDGRHPGSNRFAALALLWLTRWNSPLLSPLPSNLKPAPETAYFGGGEQPIAVFRSDWTPRAAGVASKGGKAALPHAHMDAGSFVYERSGVRWSLEVPFCGYNEIETAGLRLWNGSQGGDRWKLLAWGPDAHNIARVNNELHRVEGHVSACEMDAAGKRVVWNLKPLFGDAVALATREVALLENSDLLVVDRWTTGENPLQWSFQWITEAEVAPTQNGWILSQDGATLRLVVESNGPLIYEIQPLSEIDSPVQKVAPQLVRLSIHAKAPASAQCWLSVRAIR